MWKAIVTSCLWILALASPSSGAVCVDVGKPGCEATLQEALLVAAPGETIRVAKGVYQGPVTIGVQDVSLIGASGAVIEADPALAATASVRIAANGVTLEGLSLRLATSDGVRIEPDVVGTTLRELRIVGAARSCIHVGERAHDTKISLGHLSGCRLEGVRAEQADRLVVREMEIDRIRGTGVQVEGGSEARILRNQIRSIWAECLYLPNVVSAEVSGNLCENVNGYGIYMEGTDGVITDNQVDGAGSLGIRYGCDACSGGEVSRNEVSRIMGVGIEIERSVADVKVHDNRVRAITSDCFRTAEGTSRVELRGNHAEECQNHGFALFGSDQVVNESTALRSGRDGFHLGGADIAVTNCEAAHNQEDGFDVAAGAAPSARAELRSNHAERNLGVGIEVSAGATDTVVHDNTAEQNGRADACNAGTQTDLQRNRFDREETPSGPDCPVD